MFPSHLVRPRRSESETLLQTRLHRHKIYFRCQESPRDTSRIAVDLSEKNIDKWKKKLLVKNSALWEKSFVFWLFGPRCSRPLRSPVVISGTASELLLRRTFHFPSSSQKKKKNIPSLPLILPFFDMRNGRKRVSFSRAASSLVPFDMRDRLKT